MNIDGRSLANFVLDFCDARNRKITPLSLQKIVYFCQVWSLIELGRPLLKHEFEAWQFGPVLQYLYREFEDYIDSPITRRAMKINRQTGMKEVARYQFDEDTTMLLNKVVGFYCQLSASELVDLTHINEGPWFEVWNHGENINLGMKIDNLRIQKFYSKMRVPFTVQ